MYPPFKQFLSTLCHIYFNFTFNDFQHWPQNFENMNGSIFGLDFNTVIQFTVDNKTWYIKCNETDWRLRQRVYQCLYFSNTCNLLYSLFYKYCKTEILSKGKLDALFSIYLPSTVDEVFTVDFPNISLNSSHCVIFRHHFVHFYTFYDLYS